MTSKPADASPENRQVTGTWAKGVSGNPGGRPKKLPITEAIRSELERKTKGIANDIGIARKLIKMALGGDMEAIREITDRAEGKARQRTELSGPDGGSIPVVQLPGTREEVERRLAELLKVGRS